MATYTQFFSNKPLEQPTNTLRGYANSRIDIMGLVQLPVKYVKKTLPPFRFNIARHRITLLAWSDWEQNSALAIFSWTGLTLALS